MNTPINDTLDILIRLPAEDIITAQNRKADKLETDGVSIPRRLDRKIRRQLNKAIFKDEYANVSKVAKQIATIMLVFCTCSFAFSMSIKAVREELYNTIITWYDKYFTVSYNIGASDKNNEYTDKATESMAIPDGTVKKAPTTIEEKREPQLVPMGMSREIFVDEKVLYSIDYLSNEELTLNFSQQPLHFDNGFDSENVESITTIEVNSFEAIIIKYHDDFTTYLQWSDGEYSYTIADYSGTISEELFVLIGSSVK